MGGAEEINESLQQLGSIVAEKGTPDTSRRNPVCHKHQNWTLIYYQYMAKRKSEEWAKLLEARQILSWQIILADDTYTSGLSAMQQ